MKLVYFIGCEAVRLIKIGSSADLPKRLNGQAMWTPVPLSLLVSAVGSVQNEKFLHHHFLLQWSHFEWFHKSAELQRLIEDVQATGSLPAWVLNGKAPALFRLPHQRQRGPQAMPAAA